MPSDLDDDLDQDDRTQDDREPRDVRQLREHNRELERQLRETKAKAAGADRLPDLEKELAFRRAGVDPESPQAKWLYKGYDGDLTPEAIAAAAKEAGLGQAGAQQGAGQGDNLDDEVRRLERTERATSGRNPDQDAAFDAELAQARREKWPESKFDDMLRRYGRLGGDDGDYTNTNWGW